MLYLHDLKKFKKDFVRLLEFRNLTTRKYSEAIDTILCYISGTL
jgi:hypothetical protein